MPTAGAVCGKMPSRPADSGLVSAYVPYMKIFISVISVLFTLMSLGVLFAFYRTRHLGLLLIALAYGGSAVLALWLVWFASASAEARR